MDHYRIFRIGTGVQFVKLALDARTPCLGNILINNRMMTAGNQTVQISSIHFILVPSSHDDLQGQRQVTNRANNLGSVGKFRPKLPFQKGDLGGHLFAQVILHNFWNIRFFCLVNPFTDIRILMRTNANELFY